MFSNFVSTLKQTVSKPLQIQQVRYRYHAEKAANRHIRRYGYSDSLDRSGLLPHVPFARKLPMPEYK